MYFGGGSGLWTVCCFEEGVVDTSQGGILALGMLVMVGNLLVLTDNSTVRDRIRDSLGKTT